MLSSPNLALQYIDVNEAQREVSHNSAIRALDALVQLAALDRDLASPPGSPSDGQRWIVAASPTGAWAGHAKHIAAWQDGAWRFYAPQVGWFVFVADEGAMLAWNGTNWIDALSMVTALQNLALLGVGTTADATNPFSAKLNNTLWTAKTVAEGGDGNLRYKLSKESASKTLSLLYQDNFSGRAEVGLTGDDDFHFKVSPDGSTWYEGIRIDRNSGKIAFPVSGGPREALAADRTYYVRTDGSDANSGLANSAGGAFLTIQKAINTVRDAIDLNGHNVTIQIGNGTYTEALVSAGPGSNPTGSAAWVGRGEVKLKGDTTTPSNVVVQTTTSDPVLLVGNGCHLSVEGLKLTSSGGGILISATRAGVVVMTGVMEFGTTTGIHMNVGGGASISALANYTISGGGSVHTNVANNGQIAYAAVTVTLSGTPAFTTAFAQATICGTMNAGGVTYSGAASAGTKQYNVTSNGVINRNGGALPGGVAGTTASGGQFV
jgi:hypothetical protein